MSFQLSISFREGLTIPHLEGGASGILQFDAVPIGLEQMIFYFHQTSISETIREISL